MHGKKWWSAQWSSLVFHCHQHQVLKKLWVFTNLCFDYHQIFIQYSKSYIYFFLHGILIFYLFFYKHLGDFHASATLFLGDLLGTFFKWFVLDCTIELFIYMSILHILNFFMDSFFYFFLITNTTFLNVLCWSLPIKIIYSSFTLFFKHRCCWLCKIRSKLG